MRKILFVIANYPEKKQCFFEENYSKRNEKFAELHGYDYLVSKGGDLVRGNPTWWKFTLVRDMISSGELKDGDKLVHLDADMRIDKFEQDYPCNKSFSYAIDSGNSHCMGNYAIIVNDWTKNLIDLILSEDRYKKLNDKQSVHEYFGHTNSFWHEFREQASWYSLAGIKRHSNDSFFSFIEHGWHTYGWHSAKDEDTVYSLEELYDNVEILDPAWNVTEIPGESSCIFNINKVEKENIIIRHFAGGQEWRI